MPPALTSEQATKLFILSTTAHLMDQRRRQLLDQKPDSLAYELIGHPAEDTFKDGEWLIAIFEKQRQSERKPPLRYYRMLEAFSNELEDTHPDWKARWATWTAAQPFVREWGWRRSTMKSKRYDDSHLDKLAKLVEAGQISESSQTHICNLLDDEQMSFGDFITYCAERKHLPPMPLISNLTITFESADEADWNFNQRSLEYLLPDPDTHVHLVRYFQPHQQTNRRALRDAYAAIVRRRAEGGERPEDRVFDESMLNTFKDVFYDPTDIEEGFMFPIKANIEMAFDLLRDNLRPDTLKPWFVHLKKFCNVSPLEVHQEDELLQVKTFHGDPKRWAEMSSRVISSSESSPKRVISIPPAVFPKDIREDHVLPFEDHFQNYKMDAATFVEAMRSVPSTVTGTKRKRAGPTMEEMLVRLYRPETLPGDVSRALGPEVSQRVLMVAGQVREELLDAVSLDKELAEEHRLREAYLDAKDRRMDLQQKLRERKKEIRALTGGDASDMGGDSDDSDGGSEVSRRKRRRADVSPTPSDQQSGDQESGEEGEISDEEELVEINPTTHNDEDQPDYGTDPIPF